MKLYYTLTCIIFASAGIRIRVDCLEGSHNNHYTTDAYVYNTYL